MYHSTWDLEVHARDMQERRQREAARARQTNGLRHSSGWLTGNGLVNGITRFVARVSMAFAPPVAGLAPAPAIDALVVERTPLAVSSGDEGTAPRRPARQAEPYAAMAVIARGAVLTLKSKEEPCAVQDC